MHEIVIATVSPEHRHRRPILPAFGTDHAPLVLVLYPVFYGWLAASSSLFLFFFYNVNAGLFPWYGVISDGRHGDWAPWSIWPWTTLILGMILLWKKAAAADPSLRLFSLQTLREP